MWQDAFVTVIALGAVGVLVYRWYRSRTRQTSGACPNCEVGARSRAKVPAPGRKPLTFFVPPPKR